MSNKKTWITIGACAAAALALVAALRVASQTATAEEPVNHQIAVETIAPKTADLANQMDFVGSLTASENIVVLPKLTAKVKEVRVSPGDVVKAGDVLYIMDTSDMNSQVELAQLALDSAKLSHELTTDVTLETQEDQARLQYKQAREAYETAESAYSALAKEKKAQTEALQQAVDGAAAILNGLLGGNTEQQALAAAEQAVENAGSDEEKAAAEEILNGLNAAIAARDQAAATLASYTTTINQAISKAGTGLDTAETAYRAAKMAYNAVSGENRETQEELAGKQVEQAQINYNSLMEQLGNAVVTAPADGTVLSVNVQANNYASPSSSTIMLASGQSMKAVFGLPARYFGQVQVGDTAVVQATGGSTSATVTEVAPMINPQTGTFSVTAEFVNTASFLSGATAKVTLTTQHAEGVLTLPVDCVRFEDNRAYIYLEKEGFAQKTFVTLGMTDEVVYEITSGLTAADRVISTWHPNLTDGAAVAVQ